MDGQHCRSVVGLRSWCSAPYSEPGKSQTGPADRAPYRQGPARSALPDRATVALGTEGRPGSNSLSHQAGTVDHRPNDEVMPKPAPVLRASRREALNGDDAGPGRRLRDATIAA